MTLEDFLKDKAEMERQRSITLANLNRLDGILAYIEQKLAALGAVDKIEMKEVKRKETTDGNSST
jgi:hypothetical protein